MGAWGVKVLENDYALDDLDDFLSNDPTRHFVKTLFSNYNDEFALILGAAIVDASINGVDTDILGSLANSKEYKKFFYELHDNPLTDLVPEAIDAVKRCIHNGVSHWSKNSQYSRNELYQILFERLGGDSIF